MRVLQEYYLKPCKYTYALNLFALTIFRYADALMVQVFLFRKTVTQ